MSIIGIKIIFSLTLGASASECDFDPPQHGVIIPGLNRGGCYVCKDDGGSALLTDDELFEACRLVCEADPDCVSFEVGRTDITPLYIHLDLEPINCCIEHAAVAEGHPLYVDATGDGTNCGKEASCWTSFVKSDPDRSCGDASARPAAQACQRAAMPCDEYGDEDMEELMEGHKQRLDNDCSFGDDEKAQALLDVAAPQCAASISEVSISNGGSMPACQFDHLQPGIIIPGLNRGGCYVCKDDGGSALLTNDDLVQACQQLCESNPECVSFEVGRTDITPLYVHWDFGPINCCIEHVAIAEDHPMYFNAAGDVTNCGKEASCWKSFVKSEPESECTATARPVGQCQRAAMPEIGNDEEVIEWHKQRLEDSCSYGDDQNAQVLLDIAAPQCAASVNEGSKKSSGTDVFMPSGGVDLGRRGSAATKAVKVSSLLAVLICGGSAVMALLCLGLF